MAANYWQSTHSTNWILDRDVVDKSNKKDRQYVSSDELKKLKIHYSNTIQTLGVGLKIRQRAISTGIVYFRRFYVRNSFIDCEPRLIATTCLYHMMILLLYFNITLMDVRYLASKVEECTTQAKKYVMKMREMDATFPYDMNNIYTYYLHDELLIDCTSLQPFLADLNMESSLELVWSIVNDSYRTDVSLMYPPHIIGLACIFVSGIIGGKDVRPWFADLNVEMKDIWEVVKEVLDAYDTWNEITASSISQIRGKLNMRHQPLMPV